jgi:hypothetical protein
MLCSKTNSAGVLYSLSMSGPEVMVVSGGVRLPIVHSHSSHCSANVPCGSRARMAKKWSPARRLSYSFGEVQFSSMTPSSQHQNVAPVTSEVKVKVALLRSTTSSGPPRMIPSGGGATVHVYGAGDWSARPATSIARTRSVWLPRVRSENCCGEVHEL